MASDASAELPTLTVLRPQPDRVNGSAVIIAPGGGYIALALGLEGIEPASWFTSRGVTAFVLKYRVGRAARLPTVLAEGDRAIRFVRAHVKEFGIDPARIGIMGFSAGGHLAASVAVGMAGELKQPVDAIDQVSGRPNFLVLGYPWLEGPKVTADGTSQYCMFATRLKIPCNAKDYARYLPVDHVTEKTPPTFIYHTTDDALVPVESSIRFYEALKMRRVDAELHAFANGPHGSGLGGGDPALSQWPSLLDHWLRARGLIGAAAKRPK